jgi:hypothetical protein
MEGIKTGWVLSCLVLLQKVWGTYPRKGSDKVSSRYHPFDLQHLVIQMMYAISPSLAKLD